MRLLLGKYWSEPGGGEVFYFTIISFKIRKTISSLKVSLAKYPLCVL